MMKQFILLTITFFSFSLSSQEKFNIGLIGFYNLENLFDTINQHNVNDDEFTPDGKRRYTGEIYRDKLSKLAKVISELGTDHSPDGIAILGVSEIENRSVLKDLINKEKLKSRKYKIVHYDSRDWRGIDVGLLYNPKYFRVIKSKSIYADITDISEGPTRDILYVHGLFMGEDVHIMVAHWPSRRGGEEVSMPKRCRVAERMRAEIDTIFMGNENANIILMGDLNDDPSSPSVTKCLKTTGDKENALDGILFNPFYNYHKNGIGTLAYRDAWNLFDQIIISPSTLNKDNNLIFNSSHIFKKSYMLQMDGQYQGYPKRTYAGGLYQGGFSDHFPTYTVFKRKIK